MNELVGGLVVAAAALLSGAAGFGYGLVATPLLLVSGFSLPFVVTANLAISLVMRISVVYRLRIHVDLRRTTLLVGGSVPGLFLGSRLLALTAQRTLELAVGAVVMTLVAALAFERREVAFRPPGAGTFAAGVAGGVLGTIGSLNGVVPALFLGRGASPPRSVMADLAAYFVASSAIGLAFLALDGRLAAHAWSHWLAWLPGAVVANAVGLSVGVRLPHRVFRSFVLALAFAAGAAAIATAW